MEAGYFEKVDELCDRYSLKGFVNVKGMLPIPYCLFITHIACMVYAYEFLKCANRWTLTLFVIYLKKKQALLFTIGKQYCNMMNSELWNCLSCVCIFTFLLINDAKLSCFAPLLKFPNGMLTKKLFKTSFLIILS